MSQDLQSEKLESSQLLDVDRVIYKNKIIDRLISEDKYICESKERSVFFTSIVQSCKNGDIYKIVQTLKSCKFRVITKSEEHHHIYNILYNYKNPRIMKFFVLKKILDPHRPKKTNGYSILHIECKRKNPLMIDNMLSIPEVNVNVISKNKGQKITPLHVAIKNFNYDTIKKLLSHPHIDPNFKTIANWTYLHYACSKVCHINFDINIIKLLLTSTNFDINAVTLEGFTSLHISLNFIPYKISKNMNKICNLVNILLSHGADPLILYPSGISLIDFVLNRRNISLIKSFLKSDRLNHIYIKKSSFIFHGYRGFEAFSLIMNDRRYNKDEIYSILDRFFTTGNCVYNFVTYLLINGFEFDMNKVMSLISKVRAKNGIIDLVNEYNENKEYCDILWRLRIYYKSTLAAKFYSLLDYEVEDRELSSEIKRFFRIVNKVNDDIKQLICCRIFESTHNYIPSFYINNHHLIV